MFFTKEEVAAVHKTIQVTEEGTARTYDLSTRRTAESVYDKIMATVQDDMYVDTELEFTTQEKSFIITCLPKKMTIQDGKVLDPLLNKIQ